MCLFCVNTHNLVYVAKLEFRGGGCKNILALPKSVAPKVMPFLFINPKQSVMLPKNNY